MVGADGGDGGAAAAVTWILKAGSEADTLPLLTLIAMLAKVPTFALEGVPLRVPVEVLNVAHDGRFWTLKVSALPVGLVTVGVKE